MAENFGIVRNVSAKYDLSPRAAAELLAVHEDTVRKWAANGALPAMRTPGGWWRFSAADIEAFIERQRHVVPTEASA